MVQFILPKISGPYNDLHLSVYAPNFGMRYTFHNQNMHLDKRSILRILSQTPLVSFRVTTFSAVILSLNKEWAFCFVFKSLK